MEGGRKVSVAVGGVAEGRKTVCWVEKVGGKKKRKIEADKREEWNGMKRTQREK